MKTVPLAIALLLVLTSFADAKEKRRKHTMTSAPASAPWRASEPAIQSGGARMIEVKPGYWISSFGCVQDAGYGRLTPCDLTDGNSGR
jgi:hypothetical protein